jgi:hypothetical protein
MSGAFELLKQSGAGKLQRVEALLEHSLFRGGLNVGSLLLARFPFLDLIGNCLAFPATSHNSIHHYPQFRNSTRPILTRSELASKAALYELTVTNSGDFSYVLRLNHGQHLIPSENKMKSLLTKAVGVFLASFILCTVAQAQKTSAAFDEKVDFSSFKTYAFDKEGARNPFVNKLIVDAIERELTSRGLTKVNTEPDLKVVYLAATVPNLQVQNVPFYHVVNPAYSGMAGSSTMNMWDVTTGTLVIDLWERKSDRVVFRGTITDVLQRAPSADLQADAKIVSKPINKGVAKIFKKYPVKPRG